MPGKNLLSLYTKEQLQFCRGHRSNPPLCARDQAAINSKPVCSSEESVCTSLCGSKGERGWRGGRRGRSRHVLCLPFASHHPHSQTQEDRCVLQSQQSTLDGSSLLDRWQVCHSGSLPEQLIDSLTIRSRLSEPQLEPDLLPTHALQSSCAAREVAGEAEAIRGGRTGLPRQVQKPKTHPNALQSNPALLQSRSLLNGHGCHSLCSIWTLRTALRSQGKFGNPLKTKPESRY